MSTPWADSTVVLNAKVNCRPWVTVPFVQSTSVLKMDLVWAFMYLHLGNTVDLFILNMHMSKPIYGIKNK